MVIGIFGDAAMQTQIVSNTVQGLDQENLIFPNPVNAHKWHRRVRCWRSGRLSHQAQRSERQAAMQR